MTNAAQNASKAPRKHKLYWQLGYILGTLVLIIALGGTDPQLITLFSGKLPVDAPWLLLCGVAIIGFWLWQAGAYAYIGSIVDARISFWANVRITLFGEYYSAITPFASGGQPMQIGYYKRYGVNAAKASSILAVRYIGYISAICVCYIASLAFGGRQILADYPLVFWLTAIGFVVNFLSIAMVGLLLTRAELVRRIGQWVIRTLTCMPFFKHRQEAWNAAYLRGMEEFKVAAQCIRSHPYRCLLAFGMMLVSVLHMFSVAYLVYRALGLYQSSYIDLFTMQLFLYLAVAFVPTPGAAGATEGGFYLFFAMVFPKSLLYSAMLLWRLFTYYVNLLVGGVLVVSDELHAMRMRRREAKAADAMATVQAAEAAMQETAVREASGHEPAVNKLSMAEPSVVKPSVTQPAADNTPLR